jgi:hypothetical protein
MLSPPLLPDQSFLATSSQIWLTPSRHQQAAAAARPVLFATPDEATACRKEQPQRQGNPAQRAANGQASAASKLFTSAPADFVLPPHLY